MWFLFRTASTSGAPHNSSRSVFAQVDLDTVLCRIGMQMKHCIPCTVDGILTVFVDRCPVHFSCKCLLLPYEGPFCWLICKDYVFVFSPEWWQLNLSEEHMGDGFTLPAEPVSDDGDMTRLVLQHCVMPAYQFIIQVQPDQPTVINPYHTLSLCGDFSLWGSKKTKRGQEKKKQSTFYHTFRVSGGSVVHFKALWQQPF